jgi:ribosomal protein S18 acetylase RimI-like enzyme
VATHQIRIEAAVEVTAELVEAFARLIPQLTSTDPAPGAAELREMVEAPGTTLLVARDDGATIVGALALIVGRTPTGLRAHIESVVVDRAHRGRGIGEALCREALSRAAAAGADTVDLTSSPERAAANRLYVRLGFERRETNVYRVVVRGCS